MNSAESPCEHPRQCCLWLNRAALRYWSFHVCVSAAPTFAFMVLDGAGATQVAGMLLGILFFIALYTLCARWTFPSETSSAPWRRALRLGTWIRTLWAALALPCVVLSGKSMSVLFTPDIFAGVIAYSLTGRIAGLAPVRWLRILIAGDDPSQRRDHFLVGGMDSLLPTFLTTVIEGFILSALLFAMAFVCLVILRLVGKSVSISTTTKTHS